MKLACHSGGYGPDVVTLPIYPIVIAIAHDPSARSLFSDMASSFLVGAVRIFGYRVRFYAAMKQRGVSVANHIGKLPFDYRGEVGQMR